MLVQSLLYDQIGGKMATTKEVHDYIIDSLGNLGIGEFSARKMMGEYCVYFKDKLIGGIYDDMFLLKPTSSAPACCQLLNVPVLIKALEHR